MKKHRLASAILVLSLLVFPSVVFGAARSCSVTPNPVPLGSSFDVHASGMTPNVTYWLNITQARDPSNSGHPNWSIEIGPDGTGVSTVPSTTWSPDGILVVGAAHVRVYPFDSAGKGTANCDFAVV